MRKGKPIAWACCGVKPARSPKRSERTKYEAALKATTPRAAIANPRTMHIRRVATTRRVSADESFRSAFILAFMGRVFNLLKRQCGQMQRGGRKFCPEMLPGEPTMIRKLKSGQFRLYSRKLNPK